MLRHIHRATQQHAVGRALNTADACAQGQVDRIVAKGQGEQRGQHVVVDDPDGVLERTFRQARDHVGQIQGRQRHGVLTGVFGDRHRSAAGQSAERDASAIAEQDGIVDLPLHTAGDLLGQVGGQRVCVFQQLIGDWHKCHQLLQAELGRAQLRLDRVACRAFALPVDGNAVRSPRGGFVFRQNHRIAGDLDVVGQRQQGLVVNRQLEDVVCELRRHQKARISASQFGAKRAGSRCVAKG